MSSVVQMLAGEIPVKYSPLRSDQELSGNSGSNNTNSSMKSRDYEDNSRIDCVTSDYSSGSVYCNYQETGFLPSTNVSSPLGGNSQN